MITIKKKQGLSAERQYYLYAKRLSQLVFNRYRRYLDKAKKRSSKYVLNHRYAVEEGWLEKIPLDLRVLCHPANLIVTPTAKAGITKKENFTLKQLKRAIKKFEREVTVTWKWKIPYKLTWEDAKAKSKGLRVIGMDPGSTNYGVFVGDIVGKQKVESFIPIESSYIIHTLKGIKSGPDLHLFTKEIKELFEHYQPDVVCIERFVSRGLRGSEAEKIGMMNGIISTVAENMKGRKTPTVRFVMAATWKNRYNKLRDLKEDYKKIPLTNHQWDAAMIALFAFPYPGDNAYSYIKKNFMRFTKACHKVSIKI